MPRKTEAQLIEDLKKQIADREAKRKARVQKNLDAINQAIDVQKAKIKKAEATILELELEQDELVEELSDLTPQSDEG